MNDIPTTYANNTKLPQAIREILTLRLAENEGAMHGSNTALPLPDARQIQICAKAGNEGIYYSDNDLLSAPLLPEWCNAAIFDSMKSYLNIPNFVGPNRTYLPKYSFNDVSSAPQGSAAIYTNSSETWRHLAAIWQMVNRQTQPMAGKHVISAPAMGRAQNRAAKALVEILETWRQNDDQEIENDAHAFMDRYGDNGLRAIWSLSREKAIDAQQKLVLCIAVAEAEISGEIADGSSFLKDQLNSSQAADRYAAIEALSRYNTKWSRDILKERALQETNRTNRALIEALLS